MVTIAIEGESDRETAIAVVHAAGHTVDKVYVAHGKGRLDPKIAGYVRASRVSPWVVFRDSDGDCPVALHGRLLHHVRTDDKAFALRIAHTMTEAWLMADAEAFSRAFAVSEGKIERDVESLPHGKTALLRLCAGSRSKRVREDMVAHTHKTGPLYASRLNEFAQSAWRPDIAAERSDSLRRAIRAIRRIRR